ncbi:hypothetical protein CEXT_468071 [Caerostris extrusa]|uniref:Uncharacterized protein n=1 Tax=Caerostris extrusa TaxID=172846 RepID=A0AAV4XVW2_CAEEX|nr:hypothetical protein CEXT_468071 [Caerostris extrusa]
MAVELIELRGFEKAAVTRMETFLTSEQSEIREIENRFFDAKALRKLLEPATRDERTMDSNPSFLNTSFGTTSDFRMPSLKIPVFHGDYNQWIPFKYLYLGVVHNNKTRTNIQRFQYLLGLLGEGLMAVIQHTPVTNDNYEEAWTKVMNRLV